MDTNLQPPLPPAPLSAQDERTWAMFAHLSVFVNLITGILGPVAALAIYLIFKDRSRYVAHQSMQSFIFQLLWWVGGGFLAVLAWTISGLLAIVLVGCLLMPFALLLTLAPLVALVYGIVGAVECSQGHNFRYWLVADWVDSLLENSYAPAGPSNVPPAAPPTAPTPEPPAAPPPEDTEIPSGL